MFRVHVVQRTLLLILPSSIRKGTPALRKVVELGVIAGPARLVAGAFTAPLADAAAAADDDDAAEEGEDETACLLPLKREMVSLAMSVMEMYKSLKSMRGILYEPVWTSSCWPPDTEADAADEDDDEVGTSPMVIAQ